MCVDEKGNLYVMARNIDIYTAEGKRLTEIPFGTPPSSCGFGDPDLQSLYIAAGPSDVPGTIEREGSGSILV